MATQIPTGSIDQSLTAAKAFRAAANMSMVVHEFAQSSNQNRHPRSRLLDSTMGTTWMGT